jgi:hypothetical protein
VKISVHPNKHTALNLARTACFQYFQQAVCNRATTAYADETGTNGRDGERRYARAARGQRAHGEEHRGGDTRLNFMVAMGWNGVLPCTYGTSCSGTGALFDTWAANMLIPAMLGQYGARARAPRRSLRMRAFRFSFRV